MPVNPNDFKVLIVATHGYERSELRVPFEELKKFGADVKIASLSSDPIKSWDNGDWGDQITVDYLIKEINVQDFDCLILPGGQINPDLLRTEKTVITLIQEFHKQGKIIAAICHAPWLLVEAQIINSLCVTSYKSIKTDIKNAGGIWVDDSVVCDTAIITSRNPDDLPSFVSKIIEELKQSTSK